MATTAGGTPYVESSDLVANYPAVSLALAEHIDDLPAAILQVVRATDSTTRTTTSLTFVDASISVTITPQRNTSAIIIMWNARGGPANNEYINYQITDSSNNTVSGAQDMQSGVGTTGFIHPLAIVAYATPATTAATTYKVRFKVSAGTGTISNAVSTGQMYAIEVSA